MTAPEVKTRRGSLVAPPALVASWIMACSSPPSAFGGDAEVYTDAPARPDAADVSRDAAGAPSDPLGTVTAHDAVCPPGGRMGSCQELEIACPGVASAGAVIKVLPPSTASIGTVVTIVGLGGAGWYEQAYSQADNYIYTPLLAAGYTMVDLSFGGPNGWLTGPGGPRALACRYATALGWIRDGVANGPLCAAGTSGGAAAIGYALSRYGMGRILRMVEVDSGPVFSRVDRGCLCTSPPVATACKDGPMSECFDPTGLSLLQAAYGDSRCTDHDASHAAEFLHDSIVGSDAMLDYPTTVRVLFGSLDTTTIAQPQGMDWATQIASSVRVSCVADGTHDLADVVNGAQAIANALLESCM